MNKTETTPAEQPKKSKLAEREEEILQFWQEKEIFKKSLEKDAPKGEFVFYDGPPFATGLPHFGNLLAGTIKDYMGRYQTMKGKRVYRRWGWDTHGLPVENIVEKELGLKSKKDIEDYGIEKFNDIARTKIFTYVDDWKKIIPRMGRFVDMENDYRTMNPSFMESVLWVFKELHKKGLVYEGFKSMHICPHCGTTLANFEVSQGYKDITDISVIAKFELTEEPGTYVLAWTTTPWTLPGNVALAVNPDIDYVKIKVGDAKYILAESRLSVVKEQYEELEKIPGSALVGLSYKPVFDYYNNSELKNRENGFKIYPAAFVTTEDGTGIVHIAPAFGEDDMQLGKQFSLPFIQHVAMDGTFKKEVTDFAGQKVKPIENPQLADIEIIKYLAGKGTLFAKEKFIHSYPHCYRCYTPLLNYATGSWFIEVTKFRDQLVAVNKNIGWTPKEIGEGRFNNILEGAPDWAISRSRFWGSPLPVWKCVECEETEVLGSLDEIKKRTSRGNTYFTVRHGQAENNVKHIESSNPETPHHLTQEGREQAAVAAEKLAAEKIEVMYCSIFPRAKETAAIIAEKIGFPKDKIIYDPRINEINVGDLDGKSDTEYQKFFSNQKEKFSKAAEHGETYTDVKVRTGDFLYDIDTKYENKRILIVSHNVAIWLLTSAERGFTADEALAIRPEHDFIQNSEVKSFAFAPIPHNRHYELDFHRPFIDEVTLTCSCGKTMKRIPDVFDCWFESGAMPYASNHYPFENLTRFNPENNVGFPADFIAEGIDQTRGWFYSMLVLSTALFDTSSYKHVIVNGLVLAEDGKKMSKHLKNYTDPMELVALYGADAVRYYMLSSPVVEAEDLRFTNRGVDEVVKKIIMRLQNVYSFFEMYGGFDADDTKAVSTNILDQWILARLREVENGITKATDAYELDRAVWPIADFVDDLSTWYLRRSRDRFKSEDAADRNAAMMTTRTVILEFSKLLAPSMPFIAEDMYLKITGSLAKESVHLEDWPHHFSGVLSQDEADTIARMQLARNTVSLGLEARAKAGMKVRQPLAKLTIQNTTLEKHAEYFDLIKDEVNVKELVFDEKIADVVLLDITLTPELKEEGTVRDLIRSIQEMRKTKGLQPSDTINLTVVTNDAGCLFVQKYMQDIQETTHVEKISFVTEGETTSAPFSVSFSA